MKKLLILSLLLISSYVLADNSQPIRTSKYPISAIDPTYKTNLPGKTFPGYRGGDQLIIYTPKFGEYTGTNEYGREAIVLDGQVFGFNGANSFIPDNGFIISGHGKAKKWINKSLMEGAYIKLYPKAKIIKSLITPDSYLYKAEQRLHKVNKLIKVHDSAAQIYYNSAFDKYKEAKILIAQRRYQLALESLNASLLLSQQAFYYAVPGKKDEFHGIWLRPIEKNKDEIAKTLDKLKATGIDNIFLETYYQGQTIFPSKIQRAEFEGWDPLESWVKQAHKRDMKVHVWFQAFYAGPKYTLNPEWANIQRKNIDKDKPMPCVSEHNGYFIDPANPDVQQFLLGLIDEIVDDYDIDGLNIDYIRYPKSLSPDTKGYLDSTWGYTKFARAEFKDKFGKDPLKITPKHALWPKWKEYRQGKVTELVSQLRSVVKNKDVTISAVIFPNRKTTLITKLQDWKTWAEKDYIDAFTPLIMSSDEYRAAKSVKEIQKYAGESIIIYPGLFEPFTDGDPVNLIHQIVAIRETGAPGIVIFDNAHLNNEFIRALSTRIFR